MTVDARDALENRLRILSFEDEFSGCAKREPARIQRTCHRVEFNSRSTNGSGAAALIFLPIVIEPVEYRIFHDPALFQVLHDYPLQQLGRDMRIPHPVGVDHHNRTP